jgi:uncharacterized protein YgbK (DUF1537 family)
MLDSADGRPVSSNDWLGVLADDLSGAAEIAGVAWRYGLSAEVTTDVAPWVATGVQTDVCCVDANTRLLSPDEAAARTAWITAQLAAAGASRLYKKTDSVLRGHVRREVDAMLGATGRQTCMLCPANPGRGRIVSGGRYMISGVPLDQTVFARDPLHPRTTALVAELLGNPGAHWNIPDVTSRDDLQRCACQLDDATLPAGGAEFFEAILVNRGHRAAGRSVPALAGRRLFVCGSPAAWAAGRAAEAGRHHVAAVQLSSRAALDAARELDDRGQVLLAIGDCSGEPLALSVRLADAVGELLARAHLDLIFVEGGATALAVLQRLGWTRLRAWGELEPGTVVLEESTGQLPRLVIKPGSYPWPEGVWAG